MYIHIDYLNNITQTKRVITQSEYENIIKPNMILKSELEINLKNKDISNKKKQEFKTALIKVKKCLAPYSEPWCTDESPIYLAINDGLLRLPPQQGGIHKIKITKL